MLQKTSYFKISINISFSYRIPEDDEEDVEADGRDVCSPTSSASLMRDGVDKIDHGHGEM